MGSPWAAFHGNRASAIPRSARASWWELGPFTVGDGAKVGSNSVVVKAVPPGATVVGIPARVVEASSQGEAGRMAFDAYAVSGDLDDPLNRVILALGSRTEDLDGRLAEILRRLESLEKPEEELKSSKIVGIDRMRAP
jgi:serine O-acetyltransferase